MITIRKAVRDDAEAVFHIRNRAILGKCSSHYSAKELQEWTKGVPSEKFIDLVEESLYLAMINDEIAATGMINCETGKVDAIFADPKYMGQGAARKILGYLEGLAISAGLTEIKLESTLNAASFYRACGYVGEEVSQYESPRGIRLDCIPMVKVTTGA